MANDRDNTRDFAKKYGQVVARAWSDPAFKKRFVSDPAGAAKEFDIQIPEGIQIKVVEDTASVRHVILPARPSAQELSDEQLQQVAGGGCTACGGSTVMQAPPSPSAPPPPPPPPTYSGWY
jgi:hypothetical protein